MLLPSPQPRLRSSPGYPKNTCTAHIESGEVALPQLDLPKLSVTRRAPSRTTLLTCLLKQLSGIRIYQRISIRLLTAHVSPPGRRSLGLEAHRDRWSRRAGWHAPHRLHAFPTTRLVDLPQRHAPLAFIMRPYATVASGMLRPLGMRVARSATVRSAPCFRHFSSTFPRKQEERQWSTPLAKQLFEAISVSISL